MSRVDPLDLGGDVDMNIFGGATGVALGEADVDAFAQGAELAGGNRKPGGSRDVGKCRTGKDDSHVMSRVRHRFPLTTSSRSTGSGSIITIDAVICDFAAIFEPLTSRLLARSIMNDDGNQRRIGMGG